MLSTFSTLLFSAFVSLFVMSFSRLFSRTIKEKKNVVHDPSFYTLLFRRVSFYCFICHVLFLFIFQDCYKKTIWRVVSACALLAWWREKHQCLEVISQNKSIHSRARPSVVVAVVVVCWWCVGRGCQWPCYGCGREGKNTRRGREIGHQILRAASRFS